MEEQPVVSAIVGILRISYWNISNPKRGVPSTIATQCSQGDRCHDERTCLMGVGYMPRYRQKEQLRKGLPRGPRAGPDFSINFFPVFPRSLGAGPHLSRHQERWLETSINYKLCGRSYRADRLLQCMGTTGLHILSTWEVLVTKLYIHPVI